MNGRPINSVSLRKYLESLMENRDKLVNQRFEAQDKAVKDARDQMEKRLAGMNEFRDTLRDQASRFITRDQFDSQGDKIRDLQKFEAVANSKASHTSMVISIAMSVAALAVGIIGIVVMVMK